MLLLLPGSSFPTPQRWPFVGSGVDKAVHLALFLVEAIVLQRAFGESRWRHQAVPLAVACALLWALGLESAQLLIPGRQWEIGDLIANAAGVMLSIPLHGMLRRG